MAAVNLNTELFHKTIMEDKPVLVDFWAPWCSYCRRIAPAYEKVSDQYRDQLVIGKVNIDEEPDLARQEQVEVIPTLILYHKGKAIGTVVAPESKAAIDTFIRETLNQAGINHE